MSPSLGRVGRTEKICGRAAEPIGTLGGSESGPSRQMLEQLADLAVALAANQHVELVAASITVEPRGSTRLAVADDEVDERLVAAVRAP